MPKLKENRIPSYRLHKQSGQAIVTLSGKDILLGRHNTPQSLEKYSRVIGEWMANGRRLPVKNVEGITVSRILAEFWAHAQGYYRDRDGGPAGELENFRQALIPLRRLYGSAVATQFGPLALRAVQQEMVNLGWCRKHINRQVGRIRQVFKWAVSQELIPASVLQALSTVAGLRRGKTGAVDHDPVRPVAEEHVEATIAHASRQVAAMAHLQLLTGMRPGEVVIMRGCDITKGEKVWIYRPAYHKTEHHEISRDIRIGPKAQKILEAFWKLDLQAYLFSPAEAEAERRQAMYEKRKNGGTCLSCGNVPGSQLRSNPKKKAGKRYTTRSYHRAIVQACRIAFPPPAELARVRIKSDTGPRRTRWETRAEWQTRLGPERWSQLRKWLDDQHWHPNQIRHTAATRLRREFGLDVAQSILGHRIGSAVTEIYAEVDAEKIADIMAQVG